MKKFSFTNYAINTDDSPVRTNYANKQLSRVNNVYTGVRCGLEFNMFDRRAIYRGYLDKKVKASLGEYRLSMCLATGCVSRHRERRQSFT